jgi:hypothetical protein
MPSAEDGKNILEFGDYEKTLRAPFAIYLDFESSLVAAGDDEQPKSCKKSRLKGEAPNTERLQSHVTNSYHFVTIGSDGKRWLDGEYDGFYRGPSAAKHCLEMLSEVGTMLKDTLQEHRECPRRTREQEAAFRAAEV